MEFDFFDILLNMSKFESWYWQFSWQSTWGYITNLSALPWISELGFYNSLALMLLDPYIYSPYKELTVFLLFNTPAFRWIILFITVQEAFENFVVDQLHSCILILRPHWRPLITYSFTAPIFHPGKFPSLHVCFLQIIFWVFDMILNRQAGTLFSQRWRSRSD